MEQLTPKQQKAIRLRETGAVLGWERTYTQRGEQVLAGRIRGDSGIIYDVAVNPEGRFCTCKHGAHHSPAANCAHMITLELDVEYGESSIHDDRLPDPTVEERRDEEERILERLAMR